MFGPYWDPESIRITSESLANYTGGRALSKAQTLVFSEAPDLENIPEPWQPSSENAWRWELAQEINDSRIRAAQHAGRINAAQLELPPADEL